MGVKKAKQTKKPEPFVPEFLKGDKEQSAINKGVELHTTDEIDAILKLPRG